MRQFILGLSLLVFGWATAYGQCGSFSVSVDSTYKILCNGDSSGAIFTTADGGTPPYVYAWNTGDSTDDITGLAADTFSLTVADTVNACIDSIDTVLTEPAPLTVTVDSMQDTVYCNGDTMGNIYISVTGGTTPYSYLWSDSSMTQDITGLDGGTYTVTVTDSNACMDTLQRSVAEPPAIDISISNRGDVSCAGGSDGYLDIAVSQGTSPYSFSWSNGENSEDIYNLPADKYIVTVTDDNNCTQIDSFTVTEPPALSTSVSKTDVILCEGENTGAIDLTVNGGVSPYSYEWSDGSTSEDLNDIPAGTYRVTVTDDNDCTIMDTVDIESNSTGFTVDTLIGLKDVSRGQQVDYSVEDHPGSIYGFSVIGGDTIDTTPQDNEITVVWGDVLGNGRITVIEEDSIGCRDTAHFTIAITVGIEEAKEAGSFKVYPNPVDNQLQIQYEGIARPGQVKILNNMGRQVGSHKLEGNNEAQLDFDSYSTGVYFVELYDQEGNILGLQKVVKQQ
jgi:hypothetical protein